ncbi:MAG: hypothetical protein ACYTEL_01545 [Planctomycetota bacterium]
MRVSTFNNLLSSFLRPALSVFRPPADCPTCPSYQLARTEKNCFYETNPNLLGTQGSQILFLQRFTKARLHFRYQENEPKRTQTAQIKNLFYQTNPNLLDRTKITNPAAAKVYEPKPAFSLSRKRTQTARKKNFFDETNPDLLGGRGSQVLLVQRFTKPSLHFRYQENEPKRTQTARVKKLFLRNEPKSSWYSRLANPFHTKAYESKAAFSLSRKRTQTNPNSRGAKRTLPKRQNVWVISVLVIRACFVLSA